MAGLAVRIFHCPTVTTEYWPDWLTDTEVRLTLYVNMMSDKYELAEMRGNPEFYRWPGQARSVHCDGVRASQWASWEPRPPPRPCVPQHQGEGGGRVAASQGPGRRHNNNISQGRRAGARQGNIGHPKLHGNHPSPQLHQLEEKHQISGVNTFNDVRIGDESSSSSSTITHHLQLLTSHKNDDWNNSIWFIDISRDSFVCLLKFSSANVKNLCIDWEIFKLLLINSRWTNLPNPEIWSMQRAMAGLPTNQQHQPKYLEGLHDILISVLFYKQSNPSWP